MDDNLELISAKFELQLKEYEEDYLRTKKFDDPNYQPETVNSLTENLEEQAQEEELGQPYQQLNSSGDDFNSTSHNTNGVSENEDEPEAQSDEENDDVNLDFQEQFSNDKNHAFTVQTQGKLGHKGEIDTTELKTILEKHQKNKKVNEMTEEKAAQIKELMKDIPQPKLPVWAAKMSDEDLMNLVKSFLAPK